MRQLQEQEIRVEIDERKEKLGYKIRDARLDKVPYMVILGKKEQENGTVTVRWRDGEEGKQDLGEMSLEKLLSILENQNQC